MPSIGPPDDAAMDRDQALAYLFGAHYRGLVAVAALILGDTPTGEDVVQDAFASLYVAWDGIEDHDAAPGYLRRSVVNLCRSRIRRRIVARRHRPEPLAVERSAEDQALRRDEWSPVVAALRTLPLRQRECLALRYLLDLSEADIANALKISTGSVKAYTHRGLVRLAALIGDEP